MPKLVTATGKPLNPNHGLRTHPRNGAMQLRFTPNLGGIEVDKRIMVPLGIYDREEAQRHRDSIMIALDKVGIPIRGVTIETGDHFHDSPDEGNPS